MGGEFFFLPSLFFFFFSSSSLSRAIVGGGPRLRDLCLLVALSRFLFENRFWVGLRRTGGLDLSEGLIEEGGGGGG